MQKKIEKKCQVDYNELNVETSIKEFIKYEIISDKYNHKFLGVFTEPKKVISQNVYTNTIVNVDFQKLVDEVLSEEDVDGIIINPAGYTHTSVAILDALKAVNIPCVEVHISDINGREEFRKLSYISLVAKRTIKGYYNFYI